MKAIVQTVFGGPEVLGLAEVPKPVPGEVREAHRRIDTAHTLGKIVLRPD